MSKLTVSQAARVIGLPRTTLRGVIKRGSVSVNPDGLVDTADLEQAGYTVDPEALAREQAGQARGTAQASPTAGTPQTDILPQALDSLGSYGMRSVENSTRHTRGKCACCVSWSDSVAPSPEPACLTEPRH